MASSIKLGNAVVFGEIYRIYYPALCFFASKYVGNEEGEDIVENIFFNLWKQQKEFSDTNHVQAYLYQSVKNSCLDFIKMTERKGRREGLVASQALSIEQDFLHDIIRSEVIAEIFRALNKLPSQCSKVVYMDFVEGKSNNEIATELSLSVQTVKNHKVRALKLLKQQFNGSILALTIVAQLFS